MHRAEEHGADRLDEQQQRRRARRAARQRDRDEHPPEHLRAQREQDEPADRLPAGRQVDRPGREAVDEAARARRRPSPRTAGPAGRRGPALAARRSRMNAGVGDRGEDAEEHASAGVLAVRAVLEHPGDEHDAGEHDRHGDEHARARAARSAPPTPRTRRGRPGGCRARSPARRRRRSIAWWQKTRSAAKSAPAHELGPARRRGPRRRRSRQREQRRARAAPRSSGRTPTSPGDISASRTRTREKAIVSAPASAESGGGRLRRRHGALVGERLRRSSSSGMRPRRRRRSQPVSVMSRIGVEARTVGVAQALLSTPTRRRRRPARASRRPGRRGRPRPGPRR